MIGVYQLCLRSTLHTNEVIFFGLYWSRWCSSPSPRCAPRYNLNGIKDSISYSPDHPKLNRSTFTMCEERSSTPSFLPPHPLRNYTLGSPATPVRLTSSESGTPSVFPGQAQQFARYLEQHPRHWVKHTHTELSPSGLSSPSVCSQKKRKVSIIKLNYIIPIWMNAYSNHALWTRVRGPDFPPLREGGDAVLILSRRVDPSHCPLFRLSCSSSIWLTNTLLISKSWRRFC